ncbi:hypothetical protein P692DRAFT_20851336 [Suillus brevipes Sb2]|nr:hypothetical protein P692DRAFT_20851336 [Suillus brevipes Sb2]
MSFGGLPLPLLVLGFPVLGSAIHGSAQHDQVSAMLVVLPRPEDVPASYLASVARFDALAGSRHKIPQEQALQDILPSFVDQSIFREHAVLHVARILCDHGNIPKFNDPDTITPRKSECYYLPTFDQEQGSTRGNMIVLRHYFLEVLAIPKDVFENIMYFVLGDRLTTDLRAVDRSTSRVDLLGLMHVCMNFMANVGKNAWGSSGDNDAVSLLSLRDVLPNRNEITARKIDFYAWLRFIDMILHALVISAACHTLQITSINEFTSNDITYNPDGVKKTLCDSVSGHAVLLLHDLMTIKELRHAIKHGHPQRVVRMLKSWTPMYYAGKSYNYAHECMELLHNIHHDWPSDSANVLTAGMLDGFVEGRAHGTNATSELLAKVTGALGHVRDLTDTLFSQLGVDEINRYHSHVKQHQDIQMLVRHLMKHRVFDFNVDEQSTHHMGWWSCKHLARHKLRLRMRHNEDNETVYEDEGIAEFADLIDLQPIDYLDVTA